MKIGHAANGSARFDFSRRLAQLCQEAAAAGCSLPAIAAELRLQMDKVSADQCGPAASPSLQTGQAVHVHGLQSRPSLNGCSGVIVSDEANGRWAVQVQGVTGRLLLQVLGALRGRTLGMRAVPRRARRARRGAHLDARCGAGHLRSMRAASGGVASSRHPQHQLRTLHPIVPTDRHTAAVPVRVAPEALQRMETMLFPCRPCMGAIPKRWNRNNRLGRVPLLA